METDILIAGSLILLSIAALLAIIMKVARAVREEPRQVKPAETAPACPTGKEPWAGLTHRREVASGFRRSPARRLSPERAGQSR